MEQNKSANFKKIALSALALSVICTVTTLALVLTNSLTGGGKQQDNPGIAGNEAMLEVLPADSYVKNTVTAGENTVDYYEAFSGDTLTGFIFTVTATGKADGLTVMTGITEAGKIGGVTITADNETPGYIDTVKTAGLLAAFKGQPVGADIEADAVSGATKTSDGILHAVIEAARLYRAVRQGG